jgi:hypothetical protein
MDQKTFWIYQRYNDAAFHGSIVSARLAAFTLVNIYPNLEYALNLHDQLHHFMEDRFFPVNRLRYYAVIY